MPANRYLPACTSRPCVNADRDDWQPPAESELIAVATSAREELRWYFDSGQLSYAGAFRMPVWSELPTVLVEPCDFQVSGASVRKAAAGELERYDGCAAGLAQAHLSRIVVSAAHGVARLARLVRWETNNYFALRMRYRDLYDRDPKSLIKMRTGKDAVPPPSSLGRPGVPSASSSRRRRAASR